MERCLILQNFILLARSSKSKQIHYFGFVDACGELGRNIDIHTVGLADCFEGVVL